VPDFYAHYALPPLVTATFFHPDYTVGPGVPPDHALTRLRAFTADRELPMFACLQQMSSPCPEGGIFFCTLIIKVCERRVNRVFHTLKLKRVRTHNYCELRVLINLLRKTVYSSLRRTVYFDFFNTGRPVLVSATSYPAGTASKEPSFTSFAKKYNVRVAPLFVVEVLP
jgi:hypothetical protein